MFKSTKLPMIVQGVLVCKKRVIYYLYRLLWRGTDAVIIGSGMGGLCTAYIMAKEGMKVCVLERNRQLGGSLQIFSRDKAIFDTGVHYIGALSPDKIFTVTLNTSA